MKSLTFITKLLSVSVIVYSIPQAVDVWESRNQSLLVSGIDVAFTSRQLEPSFPFPRKELSGQEVDSIASKNLFRKQRSQYVKPVRKVRRVKKKVILKKAPPIIEAPVKEEIKPEPKRVGFLRQN